jgi:Tol biopolymer transport system component/DNA-binding winged helix-turn-helix (wHTH) protein
LQNGFRIGEFHKVEPSLNSVIGPAGTSRLEPKVMQVLLCLADHGDQVVTKESLMRAVWPDTFVGDDVLTRAISELRRVFGDDVKDPRFIQTIPKSGYRLIAPVSLNEGNQGFSAPPRGIEVESAHSQDDRIVGPVEKGGRAPLGYRTAARPWKRGLAAMGVVAAVLLVRFVAQWMAAPPSPRIVRSVQLTFTGQVSTPEIETDWFPALVTDGARVYFTQVIGERYTLAQASVGGGEVAAIRTPFKKALLLNGSPDGSRLLVRDMGVAEGGELEGPLWVFPAAGGAPIRLGDVLAHDGAWSPDGERIVFARGEELHMARSDGREPRKLATTPGRAFWIRWSLDGTRLRFSVISRQGHTRSLWEVSAEGDGMHALPLGRGEEDYDCCGDWSPDGRHFFFRRYRDNRADIWAMRERIGLFNRRARQPVRLTSGPLHFPAAVPSRDGERLLAIGSQPRGENLRFDLRTREFAPYDAGGWAGSFAISKDGEWMAYVQYRGTETILWRSRIDGSDRLQLTQPTQELLLPRWSPDGNRIAFMGKKPGRPWKIYVIPSDGGEPQQIQESDRAEADPDWAPDGQSLMFGRPANYLAESSVPKAIHLLDLRTREMSKVPGSDGLFAPRWSPGGRYVAAMTLNAKTLRLFDFRTRTWTELGRFKTVHNPVWSRDERFLYFEVVEEVGIYRVRLSDRAVERVASLEAGRLSTVGFCVFEGLALDDSPLVACRRDDRDIYALELEAR